MPARLLPLVVALAAAASLAGCAELAPVSGGPDASAEEAQPSLVGGASSPPPGERILPILLEGSTATQAFVCASVAPGCAYQAVVPGESDLFFEDLSGSIVGGTISLTWSARTAATEELAVGIMLMGGEGDACAPIDLGSLRGRSPLRIDVTPMERPFCGGELLHAWASNGIYVGQDPAYVQLDVDQAFLLEGNVTIQP